MNLVDAIILGLVEGISEYLPISSTGHLIIAAALLGLDSPPDVKHAIDAFTIVVQGGGILAVAGLYRHRIWQMLLGLLGRDRTGLQLAINLLVAFLPAAVLGLLLSNVIERALFFTGPVMLGLAVGGVAMLLISDRHRRELGDDEETAGCVNLTGLTWRQALLIGLAQCLALWPGTSRSMTTIVGGMLVGLRARHAAEFSFLLALPTLGGACVYRGFKSYRDDGLGVLETLGGVTPVMVGILVAAISAAIAVKWLVGFVGRHGVELFGWYRLVLCIVLGVLVLVGALEISPGAP